MREIYKIQNTVNNKIYVGQSSDIKRRWRNHREVSLNPNASSYEYPLYRDMREFGIDNFSFEVIDRCDGKNADYREKFYIEEYGSLIPNGYNQAFGTIIQKKLLPETIKIIMQDLLDFTLTSDDIGEKYGVSGRQIRGINSGEYWKIENVEYPIRGRLYDINAKISEFHECPVCGNKTENHQITCSVECMGILERKVKDRPNKEELKKMIREIPLVKIAKSFDVSVVAITKWCKKYNIPHRKSEIKKYKAEEWVKI